MNALLAISGNSMNNICLIIPCFNESANIGPLIDEIDSVDSNLEIIVINDGSEDSTSEVAKKTGRATVIDLPVNLGVGGAVQTGFKYAMESNMNFAIKFDGDGQHDPAGLADLILPLQEDKADIVIGSRFISRNSGYQSSFWRRIGIKYFETLCKLLTGKKITDPTSGLRAYNRRAIAFMALHYPSFDYPEPEELVLAYKNNLRIEEISSVMRERKAGVSTISSGMSIYYMLKVTLAMLFIYIREPVAKKSDNNV